MNFTITVSGEKAELADALVALKTVMGEQVGAGSVSAAIQPPTAPVVPAATPTAPTQQYAPVIPTAPLTGVPTQQYVPTAPVSQPMPAAVPTAPTPIYTMEQLGVAAGPLVDAGRGPELTAWINQRGAQSLTQLEKSHYGEFATYLRSLGARI